MPVAVHAQPYGDARASVPSVASIFGATVTGEGTPRGLVRRADSTKQSSSVVEAHRFQLADDLKVGVATHLGK
jgi:hypothetical protein